MLNVDETYSIKLIGRRKNGGRVIFHGHDADYRICSLSWTLVEAEMVCRSMGYQTAIAATRYPHVHKTRSRKSISFNCKKSLTSLHECIQGQQKCTPDSEVAGVVCSNSKKLMFCCLQINQNLYS